MLERFAWPSQLTPEIGDIIEIQRPGAGYNDWVIYAGKEPKQQHHLVYNMQLSTMNAGSKNACSKVISVLVEFDKIIGWNKCRVNNLQEHFWTKGATPLDPNDVIKLAVDMISRECRYEGDRFNSEFYAAQCKYGIGKGFSSQAINAGAATSVKLFPKRRLGARKALDRARKSTAQKLYAVTGKTNDTGKAPVPSEKSNQVENKKQVQAVTPNALPAKSNQVENRVPAVTPNVVPDKTSPVENKVPAINPNAKSNPAEDKLITPKLVPDKVNQTENKAIPSVTPQLVLEKSNQAENKALPEKANQAETKVNTSVAPNTVTPTPNVVPAQVENKVNTTATPKIPEHKTMPPKVVPEKNSQPEKKVNPPVTPKPVPEKSNQAEKKAKPPASPKPDKSNQAEKKAQKTKEGKK